MSTQKKIAILIPCHNEEATISSVVGAFKKVLPDAAVYVYDNASTDRTRDVAHAAGAITGTEPRKGKGNVVRTMFREITADVYVLVDGDDTYPAEAVHELMAPVLDETCHMTVATRLSEFEPGSFRPMHRFGNHLIRTVINLLFAADLEDVLSGYRCFDAYFVRNIPLLANGFELETELTLQTLDKGLTIREIPIAYRARPPGSASKLNTYLDGMLLLTTIFSIFKDYKPLKCFGILGVLFGFLGLGTGSVPVVEFIDTGVVLHVPLALLATGLVLVSLLCFATGSILDTLNRRHLEQYHQLVGISERLLRLNR